MSATSPISSQIGSIMNMMGMSKNLPPNLVTPTAGLGKPQGDQVTISPTAQMMQQLVSMDLGNAGEQGELDLGGLNQLQQRGDMLAQMFQMKLKNLGTGLMSALKSAGIDPMQNMSLKNGDDGLSLLNDLPNKNAIENQLKGNEKLREQFEEMSNMAKILEMLGQLDAGTKSTSARIANFGGVTPASEYIRQSQPTKIEKTSNAAFVVNVIDGSVSGRLE